MKKLIFKLKIIEILKDKYNSIASIEMIEAVGQNYLESYFKTIKKIYQMVEQLQFKQLQ